MSNMKVICSGGFVDVAGVDGRHVAMKDGFWALRSELKDTSNVKNYGGCCLLGTGQLIPIEAALKKG